jgi:hypothetical protein
MSDSTKTADRTRAKEQRPDAGDFWRLLDEIAARGRAIRLARAAEAAADSAEKSKTEVRDEP